MTSARFGIQNISNLTIKRSVFNSITRKAKKHLDANPKEAYDLEQMIAVMVLNHGFDWYIAQYVLEVLKGRKCNWRYWSPKRQMFSRKSAMAKERRTANRDASAA